MATIDTPCSLFEEIATLIASSPTKQQVLEFRPSTAVVDRARELLDLNEDNRLSDDQRRELDQFEQAELLMRLTKARIRSSQTHDAPQS